MEEFDNLYHGIKSLWISAWLLHIEGFHEAMISVENIQYLKNDVEKLVELM
ncbi:MAG: PaREP1 family protein [Sulfolobaceae archaeon]